MRANVDCAASVVTWMCNAPSPLMVPAYVLVPGCLSTGTDSPVIDDSLTDDVPLVTNPSAGI